MYGVFVVFFKKKCIFFLKNVNFTCHSLFKLSFVDGLAGKRAKKNVHWMDFKYAQLNLI